LGKACIFYRPPRVNDLMQRPAFHVYKRTVTDVPFAFWPEFCLSLSRNGML
jgi:hypothetical protein